MESDTGKKAPYKKYVTKPATAVNNWSVIIQGNRPEHRIVWHKEQGGCNNIYTPSRIIRGLKAAPTTAK